MSSIIHKTNAVMTSKVSRTTFRKLIFNLLKYLFSLIIFKWFLQKQAPGGVLLKKVVFRSFAKFTGKHQTLACNFIKKETLVQVFSCEFWEIIKNTLFTEYLRWLLLFLETASLIYYEYQKSRKTNISEFIFSKITGIS